MKEFAAKNEHILSVTRVVSRASLSFYESNFPSLVIGKD